MRSRFLLRKENFGGLLYDRDNFEFYFIDMFGFDIIFNIAQMGIQKTILIYDNIERNNVVEYIKELSKMGLIKDNKINADIIINKPTEKSLSAPIKAYLTITDICNLRCEHCFGDFGQGSEMSMEQIEYVIMQLKELGVPQISITGGEPLCHPRIYEIIELIIEENFTIQITTNGLLINDKFVNALSKYSNQCFRVSISLDGIEGAHDMIRGKGNFSRVMDKIRYLQHNNFNFGVNTVINNYNIDTIEQYLDMLLENKITNVSFSLVMPTGRAGKGQINLIKLDDSHWKDKIVKVKKSIQEFAKKTSLSQYAFGKVVTPDGEFILEHDEIRTKLGLKRCAAGSYIVTISSNGDLFPCVHLKEFFDRRNIFSESIFDKHFKEIWDSNEQFVFMRNLEAGDSCISCESYINGLCVGGCPAISDIYTYNVFDNDPYCPKWEIK
ncbi:radical SAM/SPASM domain-containing protein [Tepidimicrobium xylanilyticum]|uniref:Radical SAM additional 4Fe4S-binding SPASM domain-containing protein n=1 Tax=Tepidimicrobium xylanilyticum TaxID=1123352 RepID=A0A1H2UZX8_9FIRM|nr:radical SAM protein [Tepidimicrobium xylanilyticum]SDW61632.1 radical SAM additional 4Fe4S-binding SPASM domain-containing protein [Tepidimicrobium xylanilyticum]